MAPAKALAPAALRWYLRSFVSLAGKQRRYLRSLGHKLQPVLHIGREGSSGEAVIAAADAQLEAHELIKVRLGQNVLEDRRAAADGLARATGSQVAQILGNTILLYRARREKPKIRLPAAGGA